MMIKIVPQYGFDRMHERAAELIKISSRGLVGEDRREFVKRASNHLLAQVDAMQPLPGEPLVHLIALGTTESVGANRNGDGFKEACCDAYHDTFRKHARLFYDHKNGDPAKSYGVVKLSALNRPMGRVELIVGVNRTKEAADRNRGLVDTRFMNALEKKGSDVGVSMACKIAYDVCSSCGNKAATREQYCTEDRCKHGGCRYNLTKVSEDGHQLHVDNPHPRWFDISHVDKPADRTAFALGVVKQASAGSVIGGAALAEHYGLVPDWNSSFGSDDRIETIVSKLAAYERGLSSSPVDAVDHGYDMAATTVRCPITVSNWTRKIGGDPGMRDKLAASVKGGFSRLSVDAIEAVTRRGSQWDRYRGTVSPDDELVVKCAALSAVNTRPSDTQMTPGEHDQFSLRLMSEQVAWCAAAHSSDECDRRIELVIRSNRAA